MGLTIVTPPSASAQVVTLEEVKLHARADGLSDDDPWLQTIAVPAALDRAELETQRQLRRATYALRLCGFPCADWIELPKPPLASVSSVAYVDLAGVTQTWASSNYTVDAPAGDRCARGRLALAYGVAWPSTRPVINAVTITFVAGYGETPQTMPALLRWAIAQDIATMFMARENHITGTIVAELPQTAARVYRSYKSYPTQVLA